ncbi:ABC transporter ATP-binding protein [Comamonadaceae bacterium M7527]|nr:ABC transporter ATP-binding protein [Comamonadaceae bacterium M7527]
MSLELKQVSTVVNGFTHLHTLDLKLVAGGLTVLLGATQAGKTSLMRVMAGLDKPSKGQVLFEGQDVTGKPVRERHVAMVYQQFINYPSMTVFDNIASPLQLAGSQSAHNIKSQVQAVAERLHISQFLQRLPAELSGGQQQRVALARALIKAAPLTLLDEPLVNLDYKLREELREELTSLFEAGNSTIVYATTEPGEALLLGGNTAVMHEGRLLQYGPTSEVFQRPINVTVATAFSDPPMNIVPATSAGAHLAISAGVAMTLPQTPLTSGEVQLGLRANAITLTQGANGVALGARVELSEISGSDTFVHLSTAIGPLVAQVPGVQNMQLGSQTQVFLQPDLAYVFDSNGNLSHAPHNNA